MAEAKGSIKRAKLDKANSVMMTTIGIAAFILVFTLVSSKTFISQLEYQNRVIAARQTAVNQLKADAGAVTSLDKSFNQFESASTNIIGGSSVLGNGKNSGDNATIILHALPPNYDFPGLVASLQNVLSGQGYTINSIGGTDNSATILNTPSANPTPVQIPFSLSVTGTYPQIQQLINTLQASIRPFGIQTINLSGSDSALSASIQAYTYYQPPKDFSPGSEVVR